MQENQTVTSAIETILSSPKVGTAVAAGTFGAGMGTQLEIIKGWLSVVSMTVGIVTAIVVLGIQLIRFERAWRERKLASSGIGPKGE